MDKKIKKILIILPVFITAYFACVQCNADEYTNVFNGMNLTSEQKEKIELIKNEEETVIRSYILNYQAKEEGANLYCSLKCKTFDYDCKSKLKEHTQEIQLEKQEALRKILQKKNYYAIRYKNLLTKEQYRILQKNTENDRLQKEITLKNEEALEKEQKIEKLKIWKKINLKK